MSGPDYYAVQSALRPHMASMTDLMSAMASIWPLIRQDSGGDVRLPRIITGELACILENCDPPEHQTPEAVAALIKDYQPTWDKIVAALSAGGDEATKSDFADSILAADAAEPEAKFDNLKDMMEWLDKPSDPTAAPAAVDVEAVKAIVCHCHDDTARKFCLDKDRCTPMAEAQVSLINASDAERAR